MSHAETGMDRPEGAEGAREHRLRFSTANALFAAFPVAKSDMRTKPTDDDCLTFLRALTASATPEEAVTFAAYLLPPREGVWWAHQCLSYLPEALTDVDNEMLAVVEAWVRDPDEINRNAALEAANAAEVESPGVWLAFAAGWSGGTMGPLSGGVVPPPPHLTPRCLNASVLGSLARIETQHRPSLLKGFVEMAITLTEA